MLHTRVLNSKKLKIQLRKIHETGNRREEKENSGKSFLSVIYPVMMTLW